MSSVETADRSARLSIRNIGGIAETDVEIAPGLTVLVGRNATNRTSLLQAIMAAMGSDDVSIKGDAEEASVELTLGDDTYDRTLRQREGAVVTNGNPYLDDPEIADLFAFLLHSNEARQAVIRQDDLHQVLMRPVDTESIETEIRRLTGEREELEAELSRLDRLQQEASKLERRRSELEGAIDEKRTELEGKKSDIERVEGTVLEEGTEQSELEERLERLQEVRSDLEEVRFDVEAERDSLEALHDRRDDLRADLDGTEADIEDDIDEVDAEIDRLRTERRHVESTVSELQTVVQFNEEMLDGTSSEIVATLQEGRDGFDADSESVTDRLLEEDRTVCWTCGSRIDEEEIESTLDRLKDLRHEKRERRNELEARIDDLQRRKRRHDRVAERRRQLRRELERIDSEIEERERRLESLGERRDELETSSAELEAEVEEFRTEERSEVLDKHKEVNELEFEIGRLQDELADVSTRIDEIDDELERRADLEAQYDDIEDELTELKKRIDRLEQSAVEQFNEHMATVLDLLDYDNIDRIWIERVERSMKEGRRTVDRTLFELHIVRTTDSGTTYEDTVDHLSESEREVTGLVFALAGYLVHEVHETVPFMLLDSLEAIDAERIATLVEYFGRYADYLVAALLPQDASAVDTKHRRISDI